MAWLRVLHRTHPLVQLLSRKQLAQPDHLPSLRTNDAEANLNGVKHMEWYLGLYLFAGFCHVSATREDLERLDPVSKTISIIFFVLAWPFVGLVYGVSR